MVRVPAIGIVIDARMVAEPVIARIAIPGRRNEGDADDE
jgi:hypothetical protein